VRSPDPSRSRRSTLAVPRAVHHLCHPYLPLITARWKKDVAPLSTDTTPSTPRGVLRCDHRDEFWGQFVLHQIVSYRRGPGWKLQNSKICFLSDDAKGSSVLLAILMVLPNWLPTCRTREGDWDVEQYSGLGPFVKTKHGCCPSCGHCSFFILGPLLLSGCCRCYLLSHLCGNHVL
jgi:hypothetical protein